MLLTGTPIENSPKELLALLGFLLPSLFETSARDAHDGRASKKARKEAKRRERLTALFAALAPDDPQSAARAKRIRALIGPFVLRRLKSQVRTSRELP